MGKIFYVMGKSSSGKDTIFNKLVQDQSLQLKTIVGYTTRPMREGEKQGREYFFVSEEELAELEKQGKVIEKRTYQTVYGPWYYFTVDDGSVDFDHDNYNLIGTLESYKKVRSYYGNEFVIPIYIDVEDGERLSRALAREREQKEPKYAELCRRFLADSKDFSKEVIDALNITKKYENSVLDDCYHNIKEEIKLYLS